MENRVKEDVRAERGTCKPPLHLIQKVRQLHAEGTPLNLTAIKRLEPELIQTVYSTTEFGWKDVLEAAEIPYGKIRTKLEETCHCLICGARQSILTAHLQKAHSLTPKKYWEQFPGAEIMAETIRAERRKDSSELPHWEPVWSPEYCLDRIREYARRGSPLNFTAMAKCDKNLAIKTLACHGSWDRALAKIGLDPLQVRKVRVQRSWSENAVLAELKSRRKNKLPLTTAALETGDTSLINACRRYFGSFHNALLAAGIQPTEVMLRPSAYSVEHRKALVEEARRVASLRGSQRWEAVLRLHEDYENIVYACFGNWKRVAEVAGVPLTRILERRYMDQDSVLEGMAEWLKKGLPLRASVVFQQNRPLYSGVLRFFGTFGAMKTVLMDRKTLKQAGF